MNCTGFTILYRTLALYISHSLNAIQPDRRGEAVLRLIHCQNADWATRFLMRKFNINARDDIVGTDFGKYLKYKRPERRGGKPFLSGKTWKTTQDPWRGISRTSFGLDYLKQYPCLQPNERNREEAAEKMFELNHYDDEDNAKYGFDVFVQRIVSAISRNAWVVLCLFQMQSCYIQHKEVFEDIPESPDIQNPYSIAKEGNAAKYGLDIENMVGSLEVTSSPLE